MAAKQNPAQQKTVERVMHEFKHGELKTADGTRKVKNSKQAIAIALHEAGASKYETPQENAKHLRQTKAKERRGETYKDDAEGHAHKSSKSERTRDELYAIARQRNIPGRSKMNKAELEHALHG